MEQNERSLKGEQKLRRLEAGLLFRVETLIAIGICLILWLGTSRISAGRLTTSDLILFVTYALALYRPFIQFARQASQTGRTAACAERLVKVVEREPSIVDGAVSAGTLAGDVEFREVTVRAPRRRRGGRKRILEEVSFRAAAGERVAVLGPNGAGKSTVLQLIARLQDPASGAVILDGLDIREYRLALIRGQMSAVFQDAILFGLTVRENLALARPGADEAEIGQAIEEAGATGLVHKLRKRLDTILRQGGRLLSAGERQRLALARAFLRTGRIWLLDEPTTGLDAIGAAQIEAALLRATEGRTTFWVTHHLATAMKMNRVMLFVDGRVRFDGSPGEFRTFLAGAPVEAYLSSLTREA